MVDLVIFFLAWLTGWCMSAAGLLVGSALSRTPADTGYRSSRWEFFGLVVLVAGSAGAWSVFGLPGIAVTGSSLVLLVGVSVLLVRHTRRADEQRASIYLGGRKKAVRLGLWTAGCTWMLESCWHAGVFGPRWPVFVGTAVAALACALWMVRWTLRAARAPQPDQDPEQ